MRDPRPALPRGAVPRPHRPVLRRSDRDDRPRGRPVHRRRGVLRRAPARDARFTGAVFAAAANFSRAHFAGAARFDGVTFTGPGAWFHRARFAAAVDFRGAVPLERADFAGVEFTGDHGDRFAAAVVHAVDSALATHLARLTSTDHAVQGEALAALNRIGIAHPRCRGAVVSAICAHLRRTTDRRAVAILRDHLHFATPDGFWSDIDLDLSGGTFTDLDLSGVGVNRFHAAGATFTGRTRLDHLDTDTLDLRGAVFHGTASLVQVIAEETADLSDTAFHGPADLSRLSVLGPATFARATFAAGAEADEVFLAEGADFTGTVNPPAGLITAAGRPGT
ncbi:pentapeptide repeat-containing protein [Actinokineospora spheciospongiae]|uniref:pentapeptide repeat-containing protein n=1 Tax=Actinokineospora spheciospongiae TaxID=909613 RepID=UPI002D21C798|nr:pentapeptide repeat-containing protein [Actinokineospora spheciospongiae]